MRQNGTKAFAPNRTIRQKSKTLHLGLVECEMARLSTDKRLLILEDGSATRRLSKEPAFRSRRSV